MIIHEIIHEIIQQIIHDLSRKLVDSIYYFHKKRLYQLLTSELNLIFIYFSSQSSELLVTELIKSLN